MQLQNETPSTEGSRLSLNLMLLQKNGAEPEVGKRPPWNKNRGEVSEEEFSQPF